MVETIISVVKDLAIEKILLVFLGYIIYRGYGTKSKADKDAGQMIHELRCIKTEVIKGFSRQSKICLYHVMNHGNRKEMSKTEKDLLEIPNNPPDEAGGV